jgi:hypothetical protein
MIHRQREQLMQQILETWGSEAANDAASASAAAGGGSGGGGGGADSAGDGGDGYAKGGRVFYLQGGLASLLG